MSTLITWRGRPPARHNYGAQLRGTTSGRNCAAQLRGATARHNLTRHLLLIGPPGSGTSNLQLYLLTQQIQRGSGFIFIDTSSDPNTLLNLTHQLKLTSRLTDLLCINLNTETPNPNITHSISSNQCVYISIPTPLNKTTLNFATTLLQNLQTQLGQLGTLPPKQPHPFILLANDLHTYAPPPSPPYSHKPVPSIYPSSHPSNP